MATGYAGIVMSPNGPMPVDAYLNSLKKQKDQEIKLLKKRYEDENKLLAQKVDSRDKRMHEIKKSMKEIIGMYEDLLSRQREEIRELSKKNEEVEVEADEYIQKDDENEYFINYNENPKFI